MKSTCTCDEINARHCQYHQELADLHEKLRVACEALRRYANAEIGTSIARQALAKIKGGE